MELVFLNVEGSVEIIPMFSILSLSLSLSLSLLSLSFSLSLSLSLSLHLTFSYLFHQFSVVSFSQEVKEEFPLNRYRSQQQLKDVSLANSLNRSYYPLTKSLAHSPNRSYYSLRKKLNKSG